MHNAEWRVADFPWKCQHWALFKAKRRQHAHSTVAGSEKWQQFDITTWQNGWRRPIFQRITIKYIDCVKNSFTQSLGCLITNVVSAGLVPILHSLLVVSSYTDVDSGIGYIHVITVTLLHLKRQRHDFVSPSSDKDWINEWKMLYYLLWSNTKI